MGAHLLQLQVHHVWKKKKQAPAAGDEGTIAQMELAHIGNRFNGCSGVGGPFLIQTTGQWSKAFGLEDLPHRRRAEGALSLVEGSADVVDGVILFAQLDDELASQMKNLAGSVPGMSGLKIPGLF